MKVFNNGIVRYNDSLKNLKEGNVFEIANLDSFTETKYKIVFKGKRINFRFKSAIKVEHNSIEYIPSE